MDRMETVITVSKRSGYFIYSHYLKSFMALFFSMGTNFHHIRCVYDWECIFCRAEVFSSEINIIVVSMMSNYYNAFLYMLIHYLHLHIIAYESIRRKKMPLICHNSRAYCPVVSQIYKLRYLRYWHHLPNLIQWHSGNLILTLIHHFLK